METVLVFLLRKVIEDESPAAKSWCVAELKKLEEHATKPVVKVLVAALEAFLTEPAA